MGRQDPKFSDEQREAVARAVLQERMTAPEVVAAAADGELGTEAFDVSESSVRGIATQARREQPQLADGPPAIRPATLERTRRLVDRGLDLLERDFERAEKEGEGRMLSNQTLTRLQKASKVLQQLQAVEVDATRALRAKPESNGGGTAPGLADRLVRELRERPPE